VRVNLNESIIQSSLDPDERPGAKYQSEKKETAPEQTKPEAPDELPKVEEQKKEESVAQTPVPQGSPGSKFTSEHDKINENYGDDDKDEDYDDKFESPSPAKAGSKAADLDK